MEQTIFFQKIFLKTAHEQESLAEILSHVTRLSTSTQRGSMAGRRYAGAEGFGFGAPW
jgi:hypothetical protein